jgi:hypothetical protein
MIISQLVKRKDQWPTNKRLSMRMTRPTRRSPIRLLSANRNKSRLKASWSLNRIAGQSQAVGRSFEATDVALPGSGRPATEFERRGQGKGRPRPVAANVRLFSAERIGDLVELNWPASR